MCYYPILGSYFGFKNMKYKTQSATNNVSTPVQRLCELRILPRKAITFNQTVIESSSVLN